MDVQLALSSLVRIDARPLFGLGDPPSQRVVTQVYVDQVLLATAEGSTLGRSLINAGLQMVGLDLIDVINGLITEPDLPHVR